MKRSLLATAAIFTLSSMAVPASAAPVRPTAESSAIIVALAGRPNPAPAPDPHANPNATDPKENSKPAVPPGQVDPDAAADPITGVVPALPGGSGNRGNGRSDDKADEGSDAAPGEDDSPPAPLAPATPPVLGESVAVAAVKGTVMVRVPGKSEPQPLGDPSNLPVGATIDTRKGTVELTSAADATNEAQTAQFRGAVFSVTQRTGNRPVTELALRNGDFSSCPRAERASTRIWASAAGKSKPVRRLWGSGHGNFRTKGRNSAATVRGTIWLTEDRCEGTLTRVKRGVVEVKDFLRNKTITVGKGEKYLARAHR